MTAGGHNGSDVTMKIKPPCHSAWTAVTELSNIINILITQITHILSMPVYLCLFMAHFNHLTTPTVKILHPRVLLNIYWQNYLFTVASEDCWKPVIQFGLKINHCFIIIYWNNSIIIVLKKTHIWNVLPPCVCVSLSDFAQPVSFENAEIGQCPNLAPPPPPPPLLPDEEDESGKEKEGGKPLDPSLFTPVPVPPAVSF